MQTGLEPLLYRPVRRRMIGIGVHDQGVVAARAACRFQDTLGPSWILPIDAAIDHNWVRNVDNLASTLGQNLFCRSLDHNRQKPFVCTSLSVQRQHQAVHAAAPVCSLATASPASAL